MSEGFTIRPALRADQRTIWRMVFHARLNPMGLNWRRFFVAVAADGSVIGCAQIKPHGDGSQELASLITIASWRGKGVGRSLIALLQMHQPGGLYLMCRVELGSFYEQFGFNRVPLEEMPPYFQKMKRMVRPSERLRGKEMMLIMYWTGK